MIVDLVLCGNGMVTELHRSHCGMCANLVREWTLPREYVMQPLRKKAAVDGHLTSMSLCDTLKLCLQSNGQLWRLIVQCCHIPQDAHDLRGECEGSFSSVLHFVQDWLALVYATHEVITCADDTIVCALQVIWDYHLLTAPRRCFIESTELSKVSFGLAEAPFAICVRAVEIREANTTC